MHSIGHGQVARVTEHQRAYKACIPCRKRKAKCDLGGRDGPPCVRCRRELRECVFSAERSESKKRKLDGAGDGDGDGAKIAASSAAQTPASDRHAHARIQRSSLAQNDSHGLQQASGNNAWHTDMGNLPRVSAIGGEATDTLASDSTPDPELTHSVMRTVVSNGNDALNLLFQAAVRGEGAHTSSPLTARPSPDSRRQTAATTYATFPTGQVFTDAPATTPMAAIEDIKLWKSSRFVKMGWLSAEEVVIYLDLFFKNMAPLTPILTDYYADHANHYHLATKEPLLCCTILMISSRHHSLTGSGSASRGYFIHEKFWQYCQHHIMKLIFSQEKGNIARTRTLGSIEALLLLCEWHPRSLHFPPETDGWDSDLVPDAMENSDPPQSSSPPDRWLEDVIEPAKRSDRMSGMLLGSALSLAHELNLFVDARQVAGADAEDVSMTVRKARLRRLLYIYVNQLASRSGSMSMMPQSLTHSITNFTQGEQVLPGDRTKFISAWTELTKLLKSYSEMVFPSEAFTEQLLHTGRYVGLLEHFQPLLKQWRNKFLDNEEIHGSVHDILSIEYNYVRMYCNSIGMQAVCERTLADQTRTPNGLAIPLDTNDKSYIEEVITGSCDMLDIIIALAERDALRFAPVRVFLRITTASVFLLKAMSISVRNGQLKRALGVLHRSIHAIRSNVVDDIHLANSYATLLELHIRRLEKGFLASAARAPHQNPAGQGSSSHPIPDVNTMSLAVQGQGQQPQDFWESFNFESEDIPGDTDWLRLPFDPAMAPFNSNFLSTFPGNFDSEGLDFIWNLPY